VDGPECERYVWEPNDYHLGEKPRAKRRNYGVEVKVRNPGDPVLSPVSGTVTRNGLSFVGRRLPYIEVAVGDSFVYRFVNVALDQRHELGSRIEVGQPLGKVEQNSSDGLYAVEVRDCRAEAPQTPHRYKRCLPLEAEHLALTPQWTGDTRAFLAPIAPTENRGSLRFMFNGRLLPDCTDTPENALCALDYWLACLIEPENDRICGYAPWQRGFLDRFEALAYQVVRSAC